MVVVKIGMGSSFCMAKAYRLRGITSHSSSARRASLCVSPVNSRFSDYNSLQSCLNSKFNSNKFGCRQITHVAKAENGQGSLTLDTSDLVTSLEAQGIPSKQAEMATATILQAIIQALKDILGPEVVIDELPKVEMIEEADFSKSKSELVKMLQEANISKFKYEVERNLLEREIERMKYVLTAQTKHEIGSNNNWAERYEVMFGVLRSCGYGSRAVLDVLKKLFYGCLAVLYVLKNFFATIFYCTFGILIILGICTCRG